MVATFDLETAVGKIRAIIGDKPDENDVAIFADDELAAFFTLEGDDLRLAAAAALDAWAAKLAVAARDLQIGDYRENTTATARLLGERAKALREAATAALDAPAFAIAEMPNGAVSTGDILWNRALGGEL